jgi:hypothetical protein
MTATEHRAPSTTWLSCAGAASRVGLTPSRIAQLRREGRLKALQTPLGWLYDPEDIERFIEERKPDHERK